MMDKREDSKLAPFSSDECADDSDEDVITSYLPTMAGKHGGPNPLVPTISVTPHSPGSKHYPVLEDNLQHLHEIHESIQQMREQTNQVFNIQAVLGLNTYSRLSASCPSLNNEPGSDPDILTSLNSSPTQAGGPYGAPSFSDIMNNPKWLLCGEMGREAPRRRSWTALDDLNNESEKRKSERQRSSMSLSSLDSEQDDPFLDQVDSVSSTGLLGTDSGRRAARGSGGASTHSLNEADLQNDFNKIVAKRAVENSRLLPARLPLQKSVSTPSILAVRDIANEAVVDATVPAIPICLRPSGTESETEEEILAAGKHLDAANIQIVLDEFLAVASSDHHAAKRRKRGSIFFRKKKDKVKKASHQWISACYGSAHTCDWCTKPLTNNKPALYCENCMTTVHQNSCKDHIIDCNKPKVSKNISKGSAFQVSIPAAKLPSNKRGSASLPSQAQPPSGNSQIINEEREGDGFHHDGLNSSDDMPLLQFEFSDEVTAKDLDTDPFLGLQDEEPDSWTPTVGKEIRKKLKDVEVKRQEHIYEFILTEKHHCLTLRVMQKVFVDGLQKHFQLGKDLERMFPRLADLTEIHLNFLHYLRDRQKSSPVVETISDILLEQFSGTNAEKLKSAYGEFCSRHRDAVDIYKTYLTERRFGEFVRHCQANPLLKKKGIPECILFVTQRLTKYPLLIEPLIKTAKDNKDEKEKLSKALALVKEILVEVDAQVAVKEKEDRKLEIYNKIEAKSFTTHRGNKFKKSNILSKNRRLRFEGVATLKQGRNKDKEQVVLVIVLSDVLFFLSESNNKYTFFTPDNKTGVVSLQKLLVREIAVKGSEGIYLISSNPAEPEMFQLIVHKPKDKQVWINAIRSAVQSCQDDEDEDEGVALSGEDRQKRVEAKQNQIRQIVDMMRQKDVEQAQLLEEKVVLQQKLLATVGVDNALNPPTYTHLVAEDADQSVIWHEVMAALQDVTNFATSICSPGTNLSRSVSSVGEHQSEAYISPTLPKRAETFGGFDNANKDPHALMKGVIKKLQQREIQEHSNHTSPAMTPDSDAHKAEQPMPKLPLPQIDQNKVPIQQPEPAENSQQALAARMTQHVYKLASIIHHQSTTILSLQALLSTSQTHEDRRPIYRHNQQLEELRNLQDRFFQEKEAWQRKMESEMRLADEKKSELARLQEQIRMEQNELNLQRDQLYRRMEVLQNQGFHNLPLVTALVHEEPSYTNSAKSPDSSAGSDASSSPPVKDSRRKPDPKWKSSSSKSTLPINLISATNQQKVAQSVQVKQQLPLKLSSKTGSMTSSVQQMLSFKLNQNPEGRRSSGNAYQRLGSPPCDSPQSEEQPTPSHSRTGSSPAAMMQAPGDSLGKRNKADRTNTYPKLSDKYKVRSPETSAPQTPTGSTSQTAEEEVIFF